MSCGINESMKGHGEFLKVEVASCTLVEREMCGGSIFLARPTRKFLFFYNL